MSWYQFQASNHRIFPCFQSVTFVKTPRQGYRAVFLKRMTPSGLEPENIQLTCWSILKEMDTFNPWACSYYGDLTNRLFQIQPKRISNN